MSDEQPAEEFRRVTAAAMLPPSLSVKDITLVYGSEARLVDNDEATAYPVSGFHRRGRGAERGVEADAMALRLRFHDEGLHATRAPQSENARAVFRSLERVRCEALGSRMMAGVANNLRARWKKNVTPSATGECPRGHLCRSDRAHGSRKADRRRNYPRAACCGCGATGSTTRSTRITTRLRTA